MSSSNNNINSLITTLPTELIIMILQKVDWKTIYNIKLVSKYFNRLVMANFDKLPKPMMTGLSISSSARPNGSMSIEFFYLHENEYVKVENFYIPKENCEPRIDKIENFLKRMDLTYIMHFEIIVTGETIIFDILNRYFKAGTIVDSLQINIQKSQSFESFSNFIQKIKYVSYLWLNKMCFLNQPIPLDYTLPMIEDLSNVCIVECECTRFVNQKMVINLYCNNKNLKRILVFSNCTNFEGNLIQSIAKRQNICSGKDNCHNNCYIYLPSRDNNSFKEDIINYFPPQIYNIFHPFENENVVLGVKECRECATNSGIALCYRTPTLLNDTKCDSVFDRTLFIDDNFYVE